MKICVVIASGQSLTDEDVEKVRLAHVSGVIDNVIAVSNVGIDKTPWADALCSYDSSWWKAYPEAMRFKGRKFSKRGYGRTEVYEPKIGTGLNSGIFAMLIARDVFEAERIILLGFDLHGTHYFGPHVALREDGRVLSNTSEERFAKHREQFSRFSGCQVINCTTNSALKLFPFKELKDAIQS